MSENKEYVLNIENLVVYYELEKETVKAINGISLKLEKGKTLGLVGETGAGKTTTALSILNLVPNPPGVIKSGKIEVCGHDMLALKPKQLEKIRGKEDADTIDVYEALDMFLPGMFAYRSILNGNISMEIPNLRDKSVRDQWRNDTACTDPKAAGDMLLPTKLGGTPDIDDSVYAHMKELWDAECQKKDANNYK